MARTLILMRHAKSSWDSGEPDQRRPLAPRGLRDATAAASILADYSLDLVLSSSSTRTRQTWETLARGGVQASRVTFTNSLYGAWPSEVITLLRGVDDVIETVLALGHEPTMSELIEQLAEPSELVNAAVSRFPTSAIAVLSFDGGWSDLDGGAMRLDRFEIPRG